MRQRIAAAMLLLIGLGISPQASRAVPWNTEVSMATMEAAVPVLVPSREPCFRAEDEIPWLREVVPAADLLAGHRTTALALHGPIIKTLRAADHFSRAMPRLKHNPFR